MFIFATALRFLVHAWPLTLLFILLASIAGAMRLRHGSISLSRWLLLSLPLCLPASIAILNASIDMNSTMSRVEFVRSTSLAIAMLFLPLALTLIYLSRGLRVFAAAAMARGFGAST